MADASSDILPGFAEMCRQARETERNTVSVKQSKLTDSLHPDENDSIFPKEFDSYTFSYLFSEAQRVGRTAASEKYYSSLSKPANIPLPDQKAPYLPQPPAPEESKVTDELRMFAEDGPTSDAPDESETGEKSGQAQAPQIPASKSAFSFLSFGRKKEGAPVAQNAPPPENQPDESRVPYEVKKVEEEAVKENRPLPFEEAEGATDSTEAAESEADAPSSSGQAEEEKEEAPIPQPAISEKKSPSPGQKSRPDESVWEEPQEPAFEKGADEGDAAQVQKQPIVDIGVPSGKTPVVPIQEKSMQMSSQSKISPRLRAIIEEKLRREEEKKRSEDIVDKELEEPHEKNDEPVSKQEGIDELAAPQEVKEEPAAAQDEIVFSSRERRLKKLRSQGVAVPSPARQAPPWTDEMQNDAPSVEKKPSSLQPREIDYANEQDAPKLEKREAEGKEESREYGLGADADDAGADKERQDEEAPPPDEKPPQARVQPVKRTQFPSLPASSFEDGGGPEKAAIQKAEPVVPSSEPSIGRGLRFGSGPKSSIMIKPIFSGGSASATSDETNQPSDGEGQDRQRRLQRIIDELSPDKFKASAALSREKAGNAAALETEERSAANKQAAAERKPHGVDDMDEEESSEQPPVAEKGIANEEADSSPPIVASKKQAAKKQKAQNSGKKGTMKPEAIPQIVNPENSAMQEAAVEKELPQDELVTAPVAKNQKKTPVSRAKALPPRMQPQMPKTIQKAAKPAPLPVAKPVAVAKEAKPAFESSPQSQEGERPNIRKTPRLSALQLRKQVPVPNEESAPNEEDEPPSSPPVAKRVLPTRKPAPQPIEESTPNEEDEPPSSPPIMQKRVLPQRGVPAQSYVSVSRRILPGGISPPSSELQKTYVPPARQKLVPKMQVEREKEDEEGQEASQATRMFPIKKSQYDEQDESEGQREAPAAKRTTTNSDEADEIEQPEGHEEQPAAKRVLPLTESSRMPLSTLRAGPQRKSPMQEPGEEEQSVREPEESLPMSSKKKPIDDSDAAPVPSPSDSDEDLGLDAPPPPSQEDEDVPVPKPEESSSKEEPGGKARAPGTGDASEPQSDDALESYAKENMAWLYEIYKIGGMSREDFIQKVRDKIAEAKGEPSLQQESTSNPAFASINKEIEKK